MIKKIENWFIGELLVVTPSIIEKAQITLVFRIIVITISLIFIATLAFYDNPVQVTQSLVVTTLLTLILLGVKHYQTIKIASHSIIILATINLLATILIIHQQVDSVSYLIVVCNLIFALYFLERRWALFYAIVNILFISYFELYFHTNNFLPTSPVAIKPATFLEYYLVALIFLALIVLMLWHFHQSFRSSASLLEEALYEQKQLTARYQELSQELMIAKDQAEEMSRLKSNFLANMSHEIRTPLNGIMGIAQVIESETEDPNIKEYLDIQRRSGNRLLNTMNSILRLSQVEAEKIVTVTKPIHIHELIQEHIDTLKVLASQKELNLEFIPAPQTLVAQVDEDMLNQILTNLIGNAIKFTPQGKVSVSTGVHTNQQLYIRVKDTGNGIAPEFIEQLFMPFSQESSGQRRKFEGIGLGLTIAKQYAVILGGDIRVDSILGKGSTFEVSLPMDESLQDKVISQA